MAERGLRLRVDPLEVMDAYEDEEDVEKRAVDNEGSSEDEIEYNARELRRLRPY